MNREPYYTLLAGLPPLPRFEGAGRLPISRERLQQRLRMLIPGDARFLERATPFLTWRKDIPNLTDREMAIRFKKLVETVSGSHLNTLIDFSVDQRTIMVALRRRHRGFDPPNTEELWGYGRYVRHIERNWERPHFKLAAVYPWVPQVKRHLEAGEVLALDRLLKNVLWDHLDRTVPPYDFGLPAVISYRMKWDMLAQWLTHNAEKARERFEVLVKEITHGQPKLFH
jgi:hypothetical protein